MFGERIVSALLIAVLVPTLLPMTSLFAAEAILKRNPDMSKPADNIDFDVQGLWNRCNELADIHHRRIPTATRWHWLLRRWADIK